MQYFFFGLGFIRQNFQIVFWILGGREKIFEGGARNKFYCIFGLSRDLHGNIWKKFSRNNFLAVFRPKLPKKCRVGGSRPPECGVGRVSGVSPIVLGPLGAPPSPYVVNLINELYFCYTSCQVFPFECFCPCVKISFLFSSSFFSFFFFCFTKKHLITTSLMLVVVAH